jgi:hypothetical protein
MEDNMAKLDQLEVSTVDQLKAARIHFLSASLNTEVAAMSAENSIRLSINETWKYNEDDFLAKLREYTCKFDEVLGPPDPPVPVATLLSGLAPGTRGIQDRLNHVYAWLCGFAIQGQLGAFHMQAVTKDGDGFSKSNHYGSSSEEAWKALKRKGK